MNRRHLPIKRGVGLRALTRLTITPLTISAARHPQDVTYPSNTVLVAVLVDPCVRHRDPFTKYAVASRSISISSLALASSFRSRLFSASSSLTGRVDRVFFTSRPSTSPRSWEVRLRRLQLPKVATGTPSLCAASCCPTDYASLMASTLNSSVYCRFGTSFSDIQPSVQTGNYQNSCCTWNRGRVVVFLV